jgi:hypothetical protein
MKYAIFIASDYSYLPCLNALLNSLEKRKINADIFIITTDLTDVYISKIQQTFSFKINVIKVSQDDFFIKHYKTYANSILIILRYLYLQQNSIQYNAVCLLDADMFVVSHNLMNLFELVENNNKLIACNETIKWHIDKNFIYNNKPIFDQNTILWKFHCAVPIFFNPAHWINVLNDYNTMALNSYQLDKNSGKIAHTIDNMFLWYICVQKHNKQNDVILFSTETMTQVHYTLLDPTKFITFQIIDGEKIWLTHFGDEIFTIHGKIHQKNWSEDYNNLLQNITDKQIYMRSSLIAILREWYELNFQSSVNLRDFYNNDPYWDYLLQKDFNVFEIK